MKKTYQGRCHCGAVRLECDVDLSAGTTRSHCSFCRRARFWFALVKAEDVRVPAAADALADYQHAPPGKQPFLHFHFCKTCGMRPFTKGGVLAALGSEFYAVNVACLDASDEELASVPIHYADGRHDAWDRTPALTR